MTGTNQCTIRLSVKKLFVLKDLELVLDSRLTVLYGRPASGKTLLLKLLMVTLAPSMLAQEAEAVSTLRRDFLQELYPGIDVENVSAVLSANIAYRLGGGERREEVHVECSLGGGALPVCKFTPPEVATLEPFPFPVLAVVEERLAAVKEASRSITEGSSASSPLARYYRFIFRLAGRMLGVKTPSLFFGSGLSDAIREYSRLLLGEGTRFVVNSDGRITVDGVELHAQSSTIVNLALLTLVMALAEYIALTSKPVCPLVVLDLPEYGLTYENLVSLARALARLVRSSPNTRIILVSHNDILPMLVNLELLGEKATGLLQFYQLSLDQQRRVSRLERLAPGQVPEYLVWGLRRLHERIKEYLKKGVKT